MEWMGFKNQIFCLTQLRAYLSLAEMWLSEMSRFAGNWLQQIDSVGNIGGFRVVLALRVATSAYLFTMLPFFLVCGFIYIASTLSDNMRPEQLQLRWEDFLSLTGYNQLFLIALMPTIIAFTLYWSSALIFTTLDFTGWLSKYKVQPGKNQPPNSVRAVNAIKVVLFNQLVIGVPLAVLAFEVTKLVTGREFTTEERLRSVPPFSTFVLQLLPIFVVREFIYFYVHKLMHHQLFYKHVHKQHHEWTAPIAVAALYCHPLEHIFANIIPVAVGPAVLQSHPLINWTWFLMVAAKVTFSHTGYHLPFGLSPEFHEYHHRVVNQNFSIWGFADALLGTDQEWRKSSSYKRLLHHRLFYKRIHKQHHEWTAPVALITVYCHPLEHVICNSLPTAIGPILLQSHPLVNWTWFSMIYLKALTTHSGYHLPFGPCSEFHDYHHRVNNQNFGLLGFLDALHGTDRKKTEFSDDHVCFMGFISSKKLATFKGKNE